MNQSSSRTSVNDIHTSPNEEDKTSPEWLFEQSQFHSVNTGNTERYFISLSEEECVYEALLLGKICGIQTILFNIKTKLNLNIRCDFSKWNWVLKIKMKMLPAWQLT